MIKLNPNQQRQPLGGHHYPSHGMTFRGETFKEVVDKLRKFRLMNCLPVGNPERDVLMFYAERFPYMVKVESGGGPEEDASDLVEWRRAITRFWNHPPIKFLSPKEAKLRWSICEKCPFNRKLSLKETEEVAELKRRAFILKRGMSFPDILNFCSCHKWDNSISIFFEDSARLSERKDEEGPRECWVVSSLGGMQK